MSVGECTLLECSACRRARQLYQQTASQLAPSVGMHVKVKTCTDHAPPTKQQRTASGRGNSNCASASNRTLEFCILYMHTMHTCTHAHTHACTHTHTHVHTHTHTHTHTQSQNSLCPLAMVNTSALWAQCYECETGAGYGSTDCCKCDSHCKSESPYPGTWEGSWAVRGIPSCSRIRQQCAQTLHSFALCPHSYRCLRSSTLHHTTWNAVRDSQ